MNELTPEQLQELKKAVLYGPAAPCTVQHGHEEPEHEWLEDAEGERVDIDEAQRYCLLAWNALPALLAALDAKEAEVKELRKRVEELEKLVKRAVSIEFPCTCEIGFQCFECSLKQDMVKAMMNQALRDAGKEAGK